MSVNLKFLSIILSLVLCASASANDQAPINEFEFRLSLGFGKLENPLIERDDINLSVIPEFSYYAERFYIENFVMGYSLFENDNFLIDAFAYINHDGYFFELDGISDLTVATVLGRTPARLPINSDGQLGLDEIERKLSYLAGFNSQYNWDNAYVQVSAAQDISGVHEGHEVKLTLGYAFQWQNLSANLSVFGINKSDKLLNYYYGLHALEWSRVDIPITESSDNNLGWRVVLNYQLDPNWSITLIGEKQFLSDTIYSSYLVDEKQVMSWFTGITRRF